RLGVTLRRVDVAVRTGDTSPRDRRQQLREPGDILITTPESLYLMLGSSARETLRLVDTVIVDEIHALAPTKRGAHLALSLERLNELAAESRLPDENLITAGQAPHPEFGLGSSQPVRSETARSDRPTRPLGSNFTTAGQAPHPEFGLGSNSPLVRAHHGSVA